MSSGNLGKCFEAGAHGEKIALIEPAKPAAQRETSYIELDREADAVARGLIKSGLIAGDSIGLIGQNSREFLSAYFGVMRAGMIAVPMSFKLPQRVIDHIFQDSEIKAAFVQDDFAGMVPDGVQTFSLHRENGFETLLDHGPFETFEPQGRELAMILYTSGSTGLPKGVMLSHASQKWSIDHVAKAGDDKRRHRYIVAAPMFHMNATISAKSALAVGASIVLLPTFDALEYAQAIGDHRVTWLTSVPTMLAMVAKESERLGNIDLGSVTNVTMGSAPLTQALIDKVQAMFPAAVINNSYGTTEGGPSPFGPHPDGVPRPALSLGYPLSGVEAKLLESDTPNQGVFYVRSPMVMEGYRNLPEKTEEVLQDGWYRSGDLMLRDEDGFYYFLGRADDMFNVGGENVWPGEVEKLIEMMEGVHQASVVPAPHEMKGQAPFAFVVLREGANLTEEDIKAFTIANGPAFSHPRNVRIVDTIPLAGTNKPDRKLLIERAARELS